MARIQEQPYSHRESPHCLRIKIAVVPFEDTANAAAADVDLHRCDVKTIPSGNQYLTVSGCVNGSRASQGIALYDPSNGRVLSILVKATISGNSVSAVTRTGTAAPD